MQFLIPSALGAPLVTHKGTAFAGSCFKSHHLIHYYSSFTQHLCKHFTVHIHGFVLKVFLFNSTGWESQSLTTEHGHLRLAFINVTFAFQTHQDQPYSHISGL